MITKKNLEEKEKVIKNSVKTVRKLWSYSFVTKDGKRTGLHQFYIKGQVQTFEALLRKQLEPFNEVRSPGFTQMMTHCIDEALRMIKGVQQLHMMKELPSKYVWEKGVRGGRRSEKTT